MNPSVRPASLTDRDAVIELLHTHMSARIAPHRWALLFDYPWRPRDAPDFGRVLVEGERIVGYLGATYVDRDLAGRKARICNMSSWYLLRPFRGRGHGRAMALDLTRDPAVTYTDLTATPQVHAMLLAHAGFAVLDRERWVLRGPDEAVRPAQLEEIGPTAPPLSHHAGFSDLRILRARTDGGPCVLALQVKKKGEGIAYHQLLHADDPGVLSRQAQAIAAAILTDRTQVLAIDRRLAPTPPPGAALEPIAQPRLYKSRDLDPDRIDNLYNEVLLLDQKLP